MITRDVLELMQCPHCTGPELQWSSGRMAALVCTSCDTSYPIIDGIPDMTPPSTRPEPGRYRSRVLLNLVANIFDAGAPLMSTALWKCSPLRFIDSENRALGRANSGVYLKAPIGTGLVLDKVLAPYHEVTILGVDESWEMLRKASRQLESSAQDVHLMRVDYTRLPFKPGIADTTQSLNGLHTFTNRTTVMREFLRCTKPDGFLSGSTLIRGHEAMVDATLERMERYGVYPMLRTFEFYHKEFEDLGLDQALFESHGAVMFFCAQLHAHTQAALG